MDKIVIKDLEIFAYHGVLPEEKVKGQTFVLTAELFCDLREAGLTDKRGRHKADNEVDELERLRRENARLKKQLEEKDMLTELLKKVQEFEGM